MAKAEKVGGIALNIPANEENTAFSSPKVLPRRLRRRLLEPKSPVSAEEIEAKLKEADLRRQQYYESLSSKARAKTKSPLRSAAQVEDPGQRLEAKLNAAELKRLSILEKAQTRLAKLDKLRQAAKTGVELRFEKEHDELGTKVESRVQKAVKNRMLLFKAMAQRRAVKRQRATQCLMQKVIQESKYKECVRAAIHKKRAAAEKNRLGFLEAEKRRACARLLRVRGVANSVYTQRENERRRMRDCLEDRLQRAKKLRAQYLRQRKGLHSDGRPTMKMMDENGECLSRMLARCWRRFVKYKKTTFALARAYHTLVINEKSAGSMPFEQLALQINSATVIQTVKALLDRLETRLTLSLATMSPQSTMENIDHLLKCASSPIPRGNTTNTMSKGGEKSVEIGVKGKGTKKHIKLVRYPARVFLCAYMIRQHPDAVFRERGEHEIALAESAANLIREFELLMKTIQDRPVHTLQENAASGIPIQKNFRSQLEAFDKVWCSYLHCFVVWKVKDAKLLEEDLMRTAHELKQSAVQNCKQSPEVGESDLAPDRNATYKQVMEKHKLVNESRNDGLVLMASALLAQSMCAEVDGAVDTIAPPNSCISSSSSSGLSDVSSSLICGKRVHGSEKLEKLTFVASPWSDKKFLNTNRIHGSPSTATTSEGHHSFDAALASENELIVNEIVHNNHNSFVDSFNPSNDDVNKLQAKVRETVEKAFWDGVMESMKQAKPDFSWVLKLMKEVRDELCEISPKDWREEIVQTIDSDILSQVLTSGSLDIDYLGNILEFALVTLQKLSAPANEEEIRTTHHKLLQELGEIAQASDQSNASYAVLLFKGLRFVLQQIQVLKKEIGRARLKMLDPLLKGPAGLEYLKKSFTNRYGPPNQVSASLPLTKQWLLSLCQDAENEWKEYTVSSATAAISNSGSSQSQGLPPITLRTGSISAASKLHSPSSTFSGSELSDCRGETVDLLVRLGVLKLVSKIGGLTLESLPETLQLNLSRLRAVQSQLQKIILISISLLILQQTLVTENLVPSPIDMENVISNCVQHLSELLDSVEDAGLPEIIETISQFPDGAEYTYDPEKLEARKRVMASMLVKSLQAGDPIFTRVSHSVYLATRAAVLAGNNSKGKHLVETALRRVGSALLSDKIMKVANVLVLVAIVSRNVHGAWYEELLKHNK